MARPVVPLLAFLSISIVIVGAATDQPLPLQDRQVHLSSNQTTYESEPKDDLDVLGIVVDTAECIGGVVVFNLDDCIAAGTEIGSILNGNPVTGLIATVTGGLGDFFAILGTLMTFNIPGAPTEIRYVLGTTITGTVLWIGVTILRGVGG